VTLIDTEEGAKRLARVILSDIELYNQQKVRSQADLKPQLDEGYALFRSRVAPALVPVFSEVVADRWSGGAKKPAAVARPVPPTNAAPVEPRREPLPPPAAHPPALPEPAPPPPAPVQATRKDPLDPREAARRLARVMVSSIDGRDRPDGGAGLAAEIEEARTLFQSCVLPELAPLFEDALAELGLREQHPLPAPHVPEPAPPLPVSPTESGQVVAITTGDLTDQTMSPETLFDEQPPPPAAEVAVSPPPDPVPPILAVPETLPPALPSMPERKPSRAWLVLAAIAVAVATAGVVYLLLT
jgi:hypothetical protein